jgi:nucleotide-binding universal stress UspA family protein
VLPPPAHWLLGPSRILVVVDDLAGQEQLLGLACHLARRLDAELLVEHIVERNGWRGYPMYAPTDPRTAEHMIDRVLESLEVRGVRAQGEVTITLSGYKARAIQSAAVESGANLIILEARRLSPFLALTGLSPVHRVVRSGHCPVLVVPTAPRPRLALRLRSGLRRIGIGS